MASVEVASDATAVSPLAAADCTLRVLVPSMKVIVPSGTTPPPPEMETVAVKVTVWPIVAGFALETNRVAVPSSTVWVNAEEALGKWLGSFVVM